ncbi:ABC-2 transporter permease [Lacrimispora defluvii]|uniref:Uncharacterized protein n=1 Tax=Lacrimispora defluvii TaxID=2719233 RepID=A0ABX1W2Y1_9FIRM|nr:ABC-2 transporter permease [Lacrimispora defluvii]NNJ32858.1 hypothetical protein [Lacrimispora defluvii]
MLLTSPDKLLGLTSVLSILLIGAVMYGVYMPIEVKYGFVKARFLIMTIIILFSLGPTLFGDFMAGIDFKALAAIPIYLKNIILAASSAVIFGASLTISIKIFQRKEL